MAAALAVHALVVSACGTEPSPGPSGTYRLAAIDSLPAAQLPCFATLNGNMDVTPLPPCAYWRRAFEVVFDSSGTAPALVFRAAVLAQSGDTSTWQLRMAGTIENGAINLMPGPEYASLTAEQWFLLPRAGTFVDGVLTLQMPTYGAIAGTSGGPVYGRPRRTVFLLTASGAMPLASIVAPQSAGISFSGMPPSYCEDDSATVPGVCTDQSFTLTRGSSTWSVDYQKSQWRVVGSDTLRGGSSLHADSLPLVQRGAYVALGTPSPPIPPASVGGGFPGGAFMAVGSVVGRTLTLFPMYDSPLGTSLPNPVILKAQ